MFSKIRSFFNNIENIVFLMAVREGFTAIMPVLMTGASTLIFKFFPIEAYQYFIETAMNGRVIEFQRCFRQSCYHFLYL